MAFPPWRHLSQMLSLGLKSFYLWLVSCFSFPPLLDPGVDKTCQDGKAGKVSLGVRRAAEGALQKPSIHESGDWAPTVCMTLGCPVGGTKEGGRPWRQFQGAQGGLKSTDTNRHCSVYPYLLPHLTFSVTYEVTPILQMWKLRLSDLPEITLQVSVWGRIHTHAAWIQRLCF